MSTLKVNTIQNTSGGAVAFTNQEGVKVYHNVDQDTMPAYSSLNVSGIVDVEPGTHRATFTSSFANVNTVITASAHDSATAWCLSPACGDPAVRVSLNTANHQVQAAQKDATSAPNVTDVDIVQSVGVGTLA